MINVMIVDDHQMLIDGIKAMLAEEAGIGIVADAYNGLEALEKLEQHVVDLVLLDINMPVMDGVETCRQIKKLHPSVRILALTMYNEGSIVTQMLQSGAHGFILKNTGRTNLIEAITEVYEGRTYFDQQVKEALMKSMMPDRKAGVAFIPKLTRREKDILRLIVLENSAQEIAAKLFISPNTVETHRRHLLEKLNVKNSAGLVRVALENKLVEY